MVSSASNSSSTSGNNIISLGKQCIDLNEIPIRGNRLRLIRSLAHYSYLCLISLTQHNDHSADSQLIKGTSVFSFQWNKFLSFM